MKREVFPKLIPWVGLHTNMHATRSVITAREMFDMFIDHAPAPEVHESDTEVRLVREREGRSESIDEGKLDIVEYSGHCHALIADRHCTSIDGRFLIT
jgi:hypothetical protein